MHDRPIIDICNLYADIKQFKFDNQLQHQSFYRRNIRAAKNLIGYPIERIGKVMRWLDDNADYKWTLESVGKHIDEDLDKLGGGKMLDLTTK